MVEDLDYVVEPLFGEVELPHSCSRCPNRWSGATRAHCKACHRTFTRVSAFDQHRVNGKCADPKRRGLTFHEFAGFGAWGWPSGTPERISALQRRRLTRE